MSSTATTMDTSTRFFFFIFFTILLSQQVASASTTLQMVTAVDNVYKIGPLTVNTLTIHPATVYGRGLFVAIPETAGEYPVVQLQHGTKLDNTDYKDLMTHVASWGFIVIAPQMYSLPSFNVTFEMGNARRILDWLEGGLIASLPKKYANHKPDWQKVALAGHSRGGMVVFGLALNPAIRDGAQKYSAIIGLDPVDAAPPVNPSILPKIENGMDVGVPTLIVGTGLGSSGLVPCAPLDKGHEVFYADVSPPSYHFVAPLQGHMDFTQDCGFWARRFAIRCTTFCPPGAKPSRAGMHQFAGGVTVAFLQDVLLNNNRTLLAALDGYLSAPINITTPEFKLPGKKPQYV